ncbi:hypothetical protein Prum_053380 [Phytohabitans rumicis]|uniref:Uncharacterized protein n=1 Tax=Phytohabitans rumicis TaxID=1076125 RepID=A0A6V8LCA9_9ACTN|nr:hypothetical protein Prum_053380 [Phytohabitans rumicis]
MVPDRRPSRPLGTKGDVLRDELRQLGPNNPKWHALYDRLAQAGELMGDPAWWAAEVATYRIPP